MPSLTSHERYQIYKKCLALGATDEIAVKIREYSHSTLDAMLSPRVFDTEIEDILYGAFLWNKTPEGFDFWCNIVDELKTKGEIK
jgi:hypothetical protein